VHDHSRQRLSHVLTRLRERRIFMARILWHSCAPWAQSGYGTQTALWILKLREMGHEVVVSTYWGLSGQPTEWNGILVLPGFGENYCSPSLHQHWQHVQPDLVVTLGDIWVLDPNVLREMPVAHWLPADCRPMSVADKNVVDMAAPELIAMSRFGEARFRQAGFDPVYVPHGIDLAQWYPAGDREAARKKTGLDGAGFVVGINAANNDAIRKAAPEQMLAFARFLAGHPDAVLSLHTNVHESGGQDLEMVAENLGITDRVNAVNQYQYKAGLVSQAAMRDWYQSLDVLMACAYGEGFGLPAVEAQACGVPVISTRASAMEELNPLGWLVDGDVFWNGVHRAWWVRPSAGEMTAALDEAWKARDDVDRAGLRQFASRYDVHAVCERHMRPALTELLGRMVKRGKVPPDRGGAADAG
jgi:glycosyltransferase involved in cell wall biosynthesis